MPWKELLLFGTAAAVLFERALRKAFPGKEKGYATQEDMRRDYVTKERLERRLVEAKEELRKEAKVDKERLWEAIDDIRGRM